MVSTEQRKSERRILKVKAVLALDGQAPMLGRTADIGANGVSVTAPSPMQVGQSGQVHFDLLVEGQVTPIHVRVRVVYCIFGGGEFKVGFQFLNPDLNTSRQLARFLR
jgi:hypothetical protein